MPFTCVFDPAGIVRTTAHGLIRFDDLAAHLRALVEAGLERAPELIDSRRAEHDLSPDDVRRLVELVSELQVSHGLQRRTALVVATPLDFGMARMYGTRAQKADPDFAVFRDLDEAEAWLRRPGDAG